jgi:endonuclease-3
VIERIIKPAGLYRQKAKTIKNALEGVRRRFGKTDLSSLKKMGPDGAEAFLGQLKGVGPKTVACVMLFSLKHPDSLPHTHIT